MTDFGLALFVCSYFGPVGPRIEGQFRNYLDARAAVVEMKRPLYGRIADPDAAVDLTRRAGDGDSPRTSYAAGIYLTHREGSRFFMLHWGRKLPPRHLKDRLKAYTRYGFVVRIRPAYSPGREP
jgi:hypothetical protein